MASQSPFPFLDDFFSRLAGNLRPPAWMLEEIQRRLLLVLNHVLMQEPEALARLSRQAGRVVEAHWSIFQMRLRITPAGLLDLAEPGAPSDLKVSLAEASPWQFAQAVVGGERPPVRIEGDVQLAADINWLVEHVRWDVEEDLSRLIGDAPAHALGDASRRIVQALRRFAGRAAPDSPQAGA
jgi:ubiquinone biosynthesis accessory factor UbiJ